MPLLALSARFGRLSILVLLAGLLAAARPAVAADEDEESRPKPGLVATYYAPNEAAPLFTRFDPVPAFLLKAGETPDPRLPATGWRAKWKGSIRILRAGNYDFALRGSGTAALTIKGTKVVTHAGSEKPTTGKIDLPFGVHDFAVTYAPQGEGAELKLLWTGEQFVQEPLPARVLGHDAAAKAEDSFPHGRLMVEEHSCTACHKPESSVKLAHSLITRPGPHLTNGGSRMKAGWVYHWLGDPHAIRPEAVMPRMFADDEVGQTQRYAVARFIASHGKPNEGEKDVKLDELVKRVRRGEQVYRRMGCTVCHEQTGDQVARATLKDLKQKWHFNALRDYLANPGQHDPAGRMPGFAFKNGDEHRDLTHYLLERDLDTQKRLELPASPQADAVKAAFAALTPSDDDVKRFAAQNLDQQLVTLAQHTMQHRRCTNCHEMKSGGPPEMWKPVPAKSDFSTVAKQASGGCLDDNRAANARNVPVFGKTLDRKLATTFLAAAVKAPGTPAPAEFSRITLQRFACLNCHERNGEGGLDPKLVESLLKNLPPADANAEAVSPPPLTGIADKALTSYIHGVLVDGRRARPWLSIQMPRFHGTTVNHLPAGFAALDADPPRNQPYTPKFDAELAKGGRTLIGEKGFGCIKCHDMLGIDSGGTRGPDLATVAERINYDWYLRWITDPQRIHAGTRMPTVFLKGESPYKDVLGGDPDKQKAALWQYLLVSKKYPHPEGLAPPKSVHIAATPGPFIMRSFLPNTSARGIAIRYPNGVHLAFDSQSCRLAYSWAGGFVDMAPVWNDRGGNQARLEGGVFWMSPDGFPWELTAAADKLPNITKRKDDPAFGATSGSPKQPPSKVRFRNYQHFEGKSPVLNYEYDAPDGTLKVSETPGTLRSDWAVGVRRDMAVSGPAGKHAWLLVAQSDSPPAWRTNDGKSGTVSEKDPSVPPGAALTIMQSGKPIVLLMPQLSNNVRWATLLKEGKWQVLAQTGPLADGQSKFAVELWLPVDEKLETAEKVLSQK